MNSQGMKRRLEGRRWVQGCPCYVAASYTSRRAWHRFLCLLVLLLWRACRSIRHPRVVLCSSDEEKPWPDSQVMRTPKDTTNSTTKIMNSAVCAICLRGRCTPARQAALSGRRTQLQESGCDTQRLRNIRQRPTNTRKRTNLISHLINTPTRTSS